MALIARADNNQKWSAYHRVKSNMLVQSKKQKGQERARRYQLLAPMLIVVECSRCTFKSATPGNDWTIRMRFWRPHSYTYRCSCRRVDVCFRGSFRIGCLLSAKCWVLMKIAPLGLAGGRSYDRTNSLRTPTMKESQLLREKTTSSVFLSTCSNAVHAQFH